MRHLRCKEGCQIYTILLYITQTHFKVHICKSIYRKNDEFKAEANEFPSFNLRTDKKDWLGIQRKLQTLHRVL